MHIPWRIHLIKPLFANPFYLLALLDTCVKQLYYKYIIYPIFIYKVQELFKLGFSFSILLHL